MEDIMWKIKQIFDGEYGCEDLPQGAKTKVSVTLVDETGQEKRLNVEDAWLTRKGLDEGSEWPYKFWGREETSL